MASTIFPSIHLYLIVSTICNWTLLIWWNFLFMCYISIIVLCQFFCYSYISCAHASLCNLRTSRLCILFFYIQFLYLYICLLIKKKLVCSKIRFTNITMKRSSLESWIVNDYLAITLNLIVVKWFFIYYFVVCCIPLTIPSLNNGALTLGLVWIKIKKLIFFSLGLQGLGKGLCTVGPLRTLFHSRSSSNMLRVWLRQH